MMKDTNNLLICVLAYVEKHLRLQTTLRIPFKKILLIVEEGVRKAQKAEEEETTDAK